MPAKRRMPKPRAAQPKAPPEAWAAFFAWGRDYFSDLATYGVDVDDLDQVQDAWATLGPSYLAQWDRPQQTYCPGLRDAQPWALLALGDPR